MKVLQIIQKRQLRGAEIFTCQISEELVRAGCEVDVAYLFGADDKLDFRLRFINLEGNRNMRLLDIHAIRKLGMLIRKNNYDIVQANSGDTLKYAVIAKLLFGWPAKLIFRNANKMSDFLKSPIHRYYNQFLLNRVDYVISVSEECRNDIVRVNEKLAGLSVTITQGSLDYSGGDRGHVDDLSDAPVLVNIASFVPEKNQLFLLDVFSEYRKRFGRGTLWLIGDGPLRQEIEKRIKSLGIERNVRLWGYRADAIALLKSADIFILPSLIEGMPGAILESMSCGVPVIVSNVGGIPEVIKHGSNGFCLKEFSIAGYVEAIEKLHSDIQLRELFVKNARNSFLKDYLVENLSKDFLDVYKRIVADK